MKENLTNEELAGMLNKAMIAYTRIFRAKRFSTVGGLTWKDNKERFVTLSNPLHNFVNDMCDIGTAYCCSQNELHQKYNEWGEGKAVSASRFNSYLLQLNAPIRQSHTTISGVATYIFQGIRPKSDFKGLAQLAQLAKIPKEVDE